MVTVKNELPDEYVTCKSHPDFNSTEGNMVVFISSKATLFRIPSLVLCTASTQFNALIKGHSTPYITLSEGNRVIEQVLRMISGLPISPWESIEDLEQALVFAEKMSFEGAISVIRSGLISTFIFTKSDPLRLYAIATQRQWEAEAKIASTYTLNISIFDPVHNEQLYAISKEGLVKLIRLHRQRRDLFKYGLDSPLIFSAGNATQCSWCGAPHEHLAWKVFKIRIIFEMDQKPSGQTLLGLDMEEWPESIACWRAACTSSVCEGRALYNKRSSLYNIKKCLDELPTSI